MHNLHQYIDLLKTIMVAIKINISSVNLYYAHEVNMSHSLDRVVVFELQFIIRKDKEQVH